MEKKTNVCDEDSLTMLTSSRSGSEKVQTLSSLQVERLGPPLQQLWPLPH